MEHAPWSATTDTRPYAFADVARNAVQRDRMRIAIFVALAMLSGSTSWALSCLYQDVEVVALRTADGELDGRCLFLLGKGENFVHLFDCDETFIYDDAEFSR